MTNSTQDTARDRARAALTAGILARLDEMKRHLDPWAYCYADRYAHVDRDLGQAHAALESVTEYVDRCEESGITMHPADVRRLIASALGVSSS